jgi:SPX domain protein involved in polyphosphate accumulation
MRLNMSRLSWAQLLKKSLVVLILMNRLISFFFREKLTCVIRAHDSDPKKEIFYLDLVYLIHFLNFSPINYTNFMKIFLILDS